MAYQVDKFNGTFLTSVEDGTIDTTTDLRFVGKNYAGYGEVQNENFLHLLENFANTSSPPKAITGQVWYDSGNKKLKFYDGNQWKSATGSEVSATAPSGLQSGELWWDTSAKQLYAYSGTEFILVGPEASPDLGTSGVTAQVVKDSGNANHSILKIQAGGKTMAIVSQTEFTLNTTVNPIDDFTVVKKGITLAKADSNGVTSDNFIFWGTASNALSLNGFSASDFVTTGSPTLPSGSRFVDSGFTVGDGNDLRVRVENDDEIVLESVLGNPIKIIINENALTRRTIAELGDTGIVPGLTNQYDLGSTTKAWQNVYATTVTGNLVGNVTGNTTGTHTGNVLATDTQILINGTSKEIGYSGATLRGTLFGSVQGNLTGTASNASALNSIQPSETVPVAQNSIPIRNTSGTIFATTFSGIATKTDRVKIDNTATDSDPDYRSAKTTATPSTIAARDSAGDLTANLFKGTATAARYADLAEKYLTDAEYEVGTVISVGGENEVTACNSGDKAIGVISENPAFMMNTHLAGGQYVALKGRVPVKVVGAVSKGDRLVASHNGTAERSDSSADTFAIALETSSETSEKLIEAVVL